MSALRVPRKAVPAEGEAVRILVADDSPTNIFVLTSMLGALGVSAATASDGAEAVEIATRERPALIFMDVQMPRMDGIAAARSIRAALQGRKVAIVAVTAHPDVRHQPAFRDAGFDDFIVKPIELSRVRQAVRRWVTDTGQDGPPGATQP